MALSADIYAIWEVPVPSITLLCVYPHYMRWNMIVYTTRKKYWFKKIRFAFEFFLLLTWFLGMYSISYEHPKDPRLDIEEPPPKAAQSIAFTCAAIQMFVSYKSS